MKRIKIVLTTMMSFMYRTNICVLYCVLSCSVGIDVLLLFFIYIINSLLLFLFRFQHFAGNERTIRVWVERCWCVDFVCCVVLWLRTERIRFEHGESLSGSRSQTLVEEPSTFDSWLSSVSHTSVFCFNFTVARLLNDYFVCSRIV